MTIQNFEELLKDKFLSRLPNLPWRVKFPFIATLDTDGFFIPEHPDNPATGTSAAYGKGYANNMGDSPLTRIPLTEDFMRLYFPGEALHSLEKLMRDRGWAQPFGNCLFNLWGGTYQNFSNWKVARGDDGKLYLNTIPLTLAFYEKLRPYFPPQQVEMMQELPLEEIAFDAKGNSLWISKGVMSGVPAEGNEARFHVSGSKEITGGTGKFKGASGSFHFAGYFDNRNPEREGEPNSIGRMGLWGTLEYWWPYPLQLSIGELTEEDLRELVQPMDIYRDNVIQQVINEKVVAEEATAS